MRSRRQIYGKVFTAKQFYVSVIDYNDGEIEETEYVTASTTGAIDSWLNGQAQETLKLAL